MDAPAQRQAGRSTRSSGRRLLRVVETVAIWLLIVGFFVGLAFGVWLLTKDGAARIDEVLARARTSTSVVYSTDQVVAPGVGDPPSVASQEPLVVEGRTVIPPRWERVPAPDYPLSRGQMIPGTVVLTCTVSETGAVTGCEIVEETPEGHGFGAAALEAALRARLSPKTIDGVPSWGVIRFTIRFSAR